MKAPLFEVRTSSGLRAIDALRGLPEVLDVALFGCALHVTVFMEGTDYSPVK